MDNETTNDGLSTLVITGLIVIAVIYVAPSLIRLGAFTATTLYKKFGKCYEATIQHEDGSIETIKVTRKEAMEMGSLEN